MSNISVSFFQETLAKQRDFFSKHQTRDIQFRIMQLKKLKAAVMKYEKKITEALWSDLHKSYEEAYLTEISVVLMETEYHIRHLKKWAQSKRVLPPFHLQPSSGRIYYEPLGVVLIVAPWNYPFHLLINPLVGAISSGCCPVLKPSPYTPAVAKVTEEMISETFDSSYISIFQGGRDVNKMLFEQKFDMIFLTGSPSLGKTAMKAAAEHLTPLVLELGGKSPCIVDETADIELAARRIAWGKTMNAGQTCIAPDYLMVHQKVKDELLKHIISNYRKMYGDDAKKCRHYARIVNKQSVERLQNLMHQGRIIYGGEVIMEEKYISPTIIDEILPEYPIMQEEIFGPILPVMTFNDLEEVFGFVNAREKPLALYYFGKNNEAQKVIHKTTSGGGCINDTLLHIAVHKLPFGGVGNSGMGKYHGRESFLAFSNARSIVNSPRCFDNNTKYAPYRQFGLIKLLLAKMYS